MTDPRVTELDYDALRAQYAAIGENRGLNAWHRCREVANHVPALLDRIEVLEGANYRMKSALSFIAGDTFDGEARNCAKAALGDLA